MDEEKKVETTVVPTATPEETPAPSQEKDPLEVELERAESKKRTRLEKLEYTRQRVEEQIAAERKKEGIPESDLDKPLTLREFQALREQEAKDTALALADAIENEAERKLVKHNLENVIRLSGDPQEDLRNARLLANAARNGMQIEEQLRGIKAKSAGTPASAPPKEVSHSELTKEEREYAAAFKLTEAEVIAARPKEA